MLLIELTGLNTGSKILVNIESIYSIYEDNRTKIVTVYTFQCTFEVKETMNEIVEKITNLKILQRWRNNMKNGISRTGEYINCDTQEKEWVLFEVKYDQFKKEYVFVAIKIDFFTEDREIIRKGNELFKFDMINGFLMEVVLEDNVNRFSSKKLQGYSKDMNKYIGWFEDRYVNLEPYDDLF